MVLAASHIDRLVREPSLSFTRLYAEGDKNEHR